MEKRGALVAASSALYSMPSFFADSSRLCEHCRGDGKSFHEGIVVLEFTFYIRTVLINVVYHVSVDKTLCHNVAVVFCEFRSIERHEFIGIYASSAVDGAMEP